MTLNSSSFFIGPDAEPDKYRLRRRFGGGGEAELWEADLALAGERERVAVKILHDHHAPDLNTWRDRWSEQVELLRLIRHPSVVGVHCQFEGQRMHPAGQRETPRALYLVMNWVDGEDLRDWVPGHLGLEHRAGALRHLGQIGEVLDWLHSGRATPSGRPVVHGDISPSNIVINSDGQAILVDFGLFRLARHSTAAPAGTRGYWAPEVLQQGHYSPASDRFAFGGLTHYLLTGTPPPESAEERREFFGELVGTERDRVDDLLLIFHDDPQRRPPAGEWARLLRLHTSTAAPASTPMPPQAPGQAPPRSPAPGPAAAGRHGQAAPATPSARSPTRSTALLAGALAALIATVAVLITFSLRNPPSAETAGANAIHSPSSPNVTPAPGATALKSAAPTGPNSTTGPVPSETPSSSAGPLGQGPSTPLWLNDAVTSTGINSGSTNEKTGYWN